MVSKRILALFSAVVAALAPVMPLWAQDSKRPIYPKGFEVTTDWQYSCPDGKGCSFSCSGSGGANNRHQARHLFGVSSDREE